MLSANIISLVLIFAVFYFMIIRPQKKRQQKLNQMLENLRTGDKIITIGGIHGTVVAIDGDTVIISTGDSEDTTLVMSKAAISQVVEETKEVPLVEDSSDEHEEDDEYEDDDEDDDDDEYEDDEEEEEDNKEISK